MITGMFHQGLQINVGLVKEFISREERYQSRPNPGGKLVDKLLFLWLAESGVSYDAGQFSFTSG
jgi:hypothetical protein